MSYLPGYLHTKTTAGAWVPAPTQANGPLRVAEEPTSLFYDQFAGTVLDTTDRWTVTNNAPTLSGGALVMPNATSQVVSKATFPPISSGYLIPAMVVKLEAGSVTGATRFWGVGTVQAGNTAVAAEGVGFEADSANTFAAVIYTGGVRTTVATLTKPTDGAYHRYTIMWRAARTYWLVDGAEVATFANVTVANQDLPVMLSQLSPAGTGAPVFQVLAAGLADNSRNNTQLSDGTYSWRKARISSAGAIDVNMASSSSNLGSFPGTLSVLAANPTAGVTTTTSGVTADISQAGNATIVVVTTGTVAATLVFEATIDPTGAAASWFPVDATRSDGSAVETRGFVTGTTATAWNTMAPGYRYLRVRLQAATTIGTIAATIVPGPFLYDPSPSITQNPLAPLQGPAAVPGSVPTPAYLPIATVTNTAIIAAPATGLSIYVTDMEGSNASAALTTTTFFEGTTTAKYVRSMAASGGGFVTNLRTPWKLAAATALTLTQSAANQGYYTVNYYVAP